MSKLPNAPLIEVIFEIRWDIANQNDIVEFQYLHGDLYSVLKEKYPIRQNLLPPEIPHESVRGVPVYRFRTDKNAYPLVQIGLGVLTINTTDDTYYWSDFKKKIGYVLDSFVSVYPKSDSLKFIPNLTYVDFFEVNFEEVNPIDFINNHFNLSIDQTFIKDESLSTKEVNLVLNYKLGDNVLSLSLRNGIFNNNKKGLVLQSKIVGPKRNYSRESLSNWINESHTITSKIFKDIIKTEFYNTFK